MRFEVCVCPVAVSCFFLLSTFVRVEFVSVALSSTNFVICFVFKNLLNSSLFFCLCCLCLHSAFALFSFVPVCIHLVPLHPCNLAYCMLHGAAVQHTIALQLHITVTHARFLCMMNTTPPFIPSISHRTPYNSIRSHSAIHSIRFSCSVLVRLLGTGRPLTGALRCWLATTLFLHMRTLVDAQNIS